MEGKGGRGEDRTAMSTSALRRILLPEHVRCCFCGKERGEGRGGRQGIRKERGEGRGGHQGIRFRQKQVWQGLGEEPDHVTCWQKQVTCGKDLFETFHGKDLFEAGIR